jgi:CxxC-x17-CxxC domain-containing protein
MSLENKEIQCFDCGATFVFTPEEQEFYQTKGYTNTPKRCPACRQARKERQDSNGFRSIGAGSMYRPQRQLFPATCARCGKSTEVPFEPRDGRPVYCRECYNSVKVSR